MGPWRWSQHWRQLLFLHWEVPTHKLQPHLPAYLNLDTCQGTAWVSLVAFRLESIQLRGWPSFCRCSGFLELNLRTYVQFNGEPGIYFLIIHAGTRLVVGLARRFTPLPYAFARMASDGDKKRRRFRSYHGAEEPSFEAVFRPRGVSSPVAGNSLDSWLLERYQAFVPDRRGKLYRMTVHHRPWQVQDAALDVTATGIGDSWGLDLDHVPDRWHYSDGVGALVWPFELVQLNCAVT
jgi:uncharacterized protein